jgi:HEAT repeat protein
MDGVDRLIELFRSTSSATDIDGSGKVRAVVALEDHLPDPRALTFLVAMVADPFEYDLARIEGMQILRLHAPDAAPARRQAGLAIAAALTSDDELVRQYAAMSLGPYADDDQVFRALAAAALNDEDIDVRYNALAAVEEAGPTARNADLLRRLAADPELGTAAARTLEHWIRQAS